MVTQPTGFFGFGSLVNLATHDHRLFSPARLSGWRRVWVQSGQRDVSFLSVTPDPDTTIEGLIATVTPADWPELDAREAAYARNLLPPDTLSPETDGIVLYQARPGMLAKNKPQAPILLSYLDVVIQGYRTHFGEAGARAFMTTTSGWSAPILNDRTTPRYPRAQQLSDAEIALVDDLLNSINARILTR